MAKAVDRRLRESNSRTGYSVQTAWMLQVQGDTTVVRADATAPTAVQRSAHRERLIFANERFGRFGLRAGDGGLIWPLAAASLGRWTRKRPRRARK